MGNSELVPQAELARRHEVSPGTVTRWKSKGVVVIRDGRVDLEETEKLLAAHGYGKFRSPDVPAVVASGTKPNGSDPDSWTLSEARRRKEIELALARRLSRLRDAGDLLERADVERAQADVARRVREAILSWPGRVAAEVAADLEVSAGDVAAVLEPHVRELLESLRDHLR